MFVYFLLKILRLGLVPKSDVTRIRDAAEKAYQGLLDGKIEEDPAGRLHLNGICKVAGLGGDPYRDGSYEYYVTEPVTSDDFKGVGPFILASMEIEGIC
jgi:unsaturated rhamnogalacturonyl hydrolase